VKKFIKSIQTARLMEKGHRKSAFGDYETALEYYRASLDHVTEEHESMVVYYCLAHTLAKLERYEEAKDYANMSLRDCGRFAGLGQPVLELEKDVRQVLEYVEDGERGGE
jgi:tetratricopeptide (TPR) repeat protein